MRAIVQDRYGSADAFELREIDRPVVGDGEVLVRVRAAGLDPSVWHLMTGLPYLVRIMGFGLRAPKARVRGTDLAFDRAKAERPHRGAGPRGEAR